MTIVNLVPDLFGFLVVGLSVAIILRMRKRRLALRGWQTTLLAVVPVAAFVLFSGVWNAVLKSRLEPFRAHLGEYTVATEYHGGQAYVRGKIIPVNIHNTTIDYDFYYTLPTDLRAARPEEVGTVLSLDCTSSEVGTYTHGGGAYRQTCAIRVIDLTLSKTVDEKSFTGSDPPRTNTGSSDQSGTFPSDEIIAYLRALPRR